MSNKLLRLLTRRAGTNRFSLTDSIEPLPKHEEPVPSIEAPYALDSARFVQHPRCKVLSGRGGFTLAEALTVVIVFGLIVVSVSTIYMAALRAYRRGEPANSAERKAAWAVSRMVPDFQQAISIRREDAPNDGTAVRVQVPDKVWDAAGGTHYNHIAVSGTNLSLVPGDWVCFYRGNDAAAMDPAGSKLWRSVLHADGNQGKRYVVADHLVDNPPHDGAPKPMFIYYPKVTRLRSVEMTITVREKSGAEVATSTMVSEVCFRNH